MRDRFKLVIRATIDIKSLKLEAKAMSFVSLRCPNGPNAHDSGSSSSRPQGPSTARDAKLGILLVVEFMAPEQKQTKKHSACLSKPLFMRVAQGSTIRPPGFQEFEDTESTSCKLHDTWSGFPD